MIIEAVNHDNVLKSDVIMFFQTKTDDHQPGFETRKIHELCKSKQKPCLVLEKKQK